MFLFTIFHVEAAEFSKSAITETCRVQESTWKKKQGVSVWLWECEKPWNTQSGASSWPINKYLGIFNGKPKDHCSSICAHEQVYMNMGVCTHMEEITQASNVWLRCFNQIALNRAIYKHQFLSLCTVWETPNQCSDFAFCLQMSLRIMFSHVRARIRLLWVYFVRTLPFPTASPSWCSLLLSANTILLEVRLSLHWRHTAFRVAGFMNWKNPQTILEIMATFGTFHHLRNEFQCSKSTDF